MSKQLCHAVATFMNELMHVPGTQLLTIQSTLRTLKEDLKQAGLPILEDLDLLIEEAGIAEAENRAYRDAMIELHEMWNDDDPYCVAAQMGKYDPTRWVDECEDYDDDLPF